MKRIDQLFDNLDEWRHLPSYQLERRADAFFSIYLGDLLDEKYGDEIESIIPEFPVRIGTIQPETDTNRSFKIDYLAKVKGKDKVFYAELKTDSRSRRDQQDWYLERTQVVGLTKILDGVIQIFKATKAKGKYRYLLEKLQSIGLLTIDEDGRVWAKQKAYSSKVVYLQPYNDDGDENIISFYEAADIIEAADDGISQRFAKSLREWADVKAGER